MALYSISICSGIAGLELSLDIAAPGAFVPALYCEREAAAAEILADRIEEGAIPTAPIWSDVRTICGPEVRSYLGERTGGERIGMLTAGYPCQPFSCAGKRAGKDDPRHLWPWIVDAIDCYRPTMCFFENVAGHVTLGFGEVRRNLEDRGYAVQAGLFSAEEVGAPHRRLRLFILAVADPRCGIDEQRRIDRDIRGTQGEAESDAQERKWGRDTVVDGSTEVDDAAACGWSRLVVSARQRREREGKVDTVRGIVAVGDAERRGFRTGGIREASSAFGAEPSIPIWPSDRRDTYGWNAVISSYPWLAPAVTETEAQSRFRGVAHGFPDWFHRFVVRRWNDRLRCYGNAVVPLTAAAAFVQLLAAHSEKVKS